MKLEAKQRLIAAEPFTNKVSRFLNSMQDIISITHGSGVIVRSTKEVGDNEGSAKFAIAPAKFEAVMTDFTKFLTNKGWTGSGGNLHYGKDGIDSDLQFDSSKKCILINVKLI